MSKKNTGPAADRRAAAREKARALAESQAKRERTSKMILRGGIGVVVLAILVIVGFLIFQSVQPAATPKTYVAGGITLSKGGAVAAPEASAEDMEGKDVKKPTAEDAKEGAPHVKVYIDYQCPACKAFEDTNAAALKKLVDEGTITLEYHPVSFLDRASGDNRYSSRAANLASCVADAAPDKFIDFTTTMFANQPAEGQTGMTDEQLLTQAEDSGIAPDTELVTPNADGKKQTVQQCVTEEYFAKSVEEGTQKALDDGISGTPTVMINGKQTETTGDAEAFVTEVLQAAGEIKN